MINTPSSGYLLGISAFRWRDGRSDSLAIGPIIDLALYNSMLLLSTAMVIHDRTDGPVNGNLQPTPFVNRWNRRRMVDTDLFPINTQPRNLSVKIREITTLEERIVAEPNPRDEV